MSDKLLSKICGSPETYYVSGSVQDGDMDKSKWPKEWKDQYNRELRRRRRYEEFRKQQEERQNRREFPELWKMDLSEESVFSFIAYTYPLHRVLKNLLQKFVGPCDGKGLLLSERYLSKTSKLCPAAYSDRERSVVILNRFKANEDWEKLFGWLGFYTDHGSHPEMHFMLGVMYLDRFLKEMDQTIWLEQSIIQFERMGEWSDREDFLKAMDALRAFAHYMNRDFSGALGDLEKKRTEKFGEAFTELINKLAA